MSVVLELNEVSLAFGGIQALSAVSFDVHEGVCTGLIGPNGAGKTALLNCVSGVYRPNSGSITHEGVSLLAMSPDQISGVGIGRTFQSMEQFSEFEVLDYLLISRNAEMSQSSFLAAVHWPSAALKEKVERRRAMDALDLFGLGSLARYKLSEVPYGSQKLIDIARVLCSDARVVLLDEPTSGTTSAERPEISRAVDALVDDGRTVIVVDHDVDFVARHAAQVAALDQGKLIALGSCADVLADPVVRRIYLGLVHEG